LDSLDKNVDIFNRDAVNHGGYLYTTHMQLSSQLATSRTIKAILEICPLSGLSVLDMACGDGFYTTQFWDLGRPRMMVGVDAAIEAIKVAEVNKQNRPIHFFAGNIHCLPLPDNSFDLVLVQSVLHHDNNPLDTIREAFRLAPQILIHEPNGNNLGLKVIEKISSYHREHHEMSYTSRCLNRWVKEAGGEIISRKFAGFVPMFCPDSLAKTMKILEPMVESVPIIKSLACAVYVLLAVR
jgi:ubiquinone/menaquinone biosynthesis C-methylase UbiE